MCSLHSLLYLGVLTTAVVANKMLDECLSSNRTYTINVVLLEDNTYAWSRPYVEAAVERAIEEDRLENIKHDLNFTLTANYTGFDTTVYNRQGCGSSTCEGVAILKMLHNKGAVGCVMLGPSCTYATFQLVDDDIGLSLSIPIISAGSFGLSCDYKPKLTRILPPARKISDLFVNFMSETLPFKDPWKKVYVYKKPSNASEDCFWYINALEAPSAKFASQINREMLRGEDELKAALTAKKRYSNIFILCGSHDDVVSIKGKVDEIHKDIMFILIDIYNPDYHVNTTSSKGMQDVLVFTLPQRNYHYGSNSTYNDTRNDYVAGYHDGTLLFGKVLRERMLSQRQNKGSYDVPLSDNPFGNTSFDGMGGHYVLDEYGDRDANFSLIYTSAVTGKYEILLVFDTSHNETTVTNPNPALPWMNGRLPIDEPENPNDLDTQDVIVIVLSLSVVVVTAIALIFYRQNRKERLMQKKWSHIDPHLIGPLDEKAVSLKIDEDKRKDSTFFSHRGRYDKKPVILKELKHTDGDFSEDQRIELNTLLRIDYYNLTKFYGTVKFEYGVFGVFELCQRGSLRYILNDRISYPDETFMDMEFKISVMYDIAKGMSYLHSSNIQVHGRLKSTNCVVDNRMVVKITDFGCHTILRPGKDVWTAPEHLRTDGVSQKGDVYSYAIIGHEIVMRRTPFYTQHCSDIAEKIYRVQYPTEVAVFRPDLNFDSASEREIELYMLIKSCWDEDPERRPDFKRIEVALGKIFSNLHNQATETYMDNLIRRLQNYSRTLERLVEERTSLSQVFSELYTDLRHYYRGSNVNLEEVLNEFWAKLLEKLFYQANKQYSIGEDYLECVSKQIETLRPFGDMPRVMKMVVTRTFVAARSFVQGLVVTGEVVRKVSQVQLSQECMRAMMRMTYCPHCRGMASARPCANYCSNVMKGCLANQADLNTEWRHLAETMMQVADRFDDPSGVDSVVLSLPNRISEAMLTMSDNLQTINSKLFQACGNIREGGTSSTGVDDSMKRGRVTVEDRLEASSNKMNKMVSDVTVRLRDLQSYWVSLPSMLCSDRVATGTGAEDKCWNGMNRARYLPEVMGDGLASQINNPEVEIDITKPDMTIRQQIMQLKIMTHRLKNALNGQDVDFQDTSDDVSGSGSGMCTEEMCSRDPRLVNPVTERPIIRYPFPPENKKVKASANQNLPCITIYLLSLLILLLRR